MYLIHVYGENNSNLNQIQQKVEPQVSQKDSNSPNEMEIIEGLMQTHDVTLSTLRSRLTKLQVVRHFWERSDIKGAINALRKLPDQSVQAV
ncbi:katanin p80 WD40 repeat-containing subunit B1 homolog KTN80.1-like isoform X2 [Cicer arietinum]|uniref:Katanin p80 WD40 repeat-containing subunit B1 homolog isoform X2 n=1 Tax=Cicer arietinum TaxID=3827 RepID=A0A1S3E3M5_CICAR|nr:katanin p80 WD40 repeat-containing subunit B1 homolog isoform X2 [Cicer arietinum]